MNPAAVTACPACGCGLERTRRSLFDRLRSIRQPKARYRCVALLCGWEGLLPLMAAEPPRRRRSEGRFSYRSRPVLQPSRR